jgi:NitT/TauT family transport system permease protein
MMTRVWPALLFAALVFMIWSALPAMFPIPEFLLPRPVAVWKVLTNNRGDLAAHAAATFSEALLGLVVAASGGIILGSLFAVFNLFERMLLPFAIASQAVPIVAVAPVLVLWLGSGIQSKIAMAALICFFPMVVSTSKGLRAATAEQLAVMHVYDASKVQLFCKLQLPSSLPFLFSGLRVSAALATIGAIVGEYAGADRGLGYVIVQSTYRLDTAELFAAIACAALGGLLLFILVTITERAFLRRFTR